MGRDTVMLSSILLLLGGCAAQTPPSGFDNVPKDVSVLLRRDAIPAVFKPAFVSVAEAQIPDEANVIGVEIGGDARAYSIDLLDGHEIVNDVVGGKKIAVTW